MIKHSLIFYFAFFLLQLIFYFVAPSFYISTPSDLVIPTFIKLAFGKYFVLILSLYLTWALVLGIFNRLLLRTQKNKLSKKALYLFLFAQLSLTLLWVTWQYPSTLDSYPGFKSLTLASSYALFLSLALLAWIFYHRQSSFSPKTLGLSLLALALPALLLQGLNPKVALELPSLEGKNHVLLLGVDALDGPTANQFLEDHLQNEGARLFEQAYTPLPLTHPAWNSILSGQYPDKHGVRYFFESPLPSAHPESYLQRILKSHGYLSLHAADQPETSYFRKSDGFDATTYQRKGWEAHMVAMLFKHFIFPSLWLNNTWMDRLGVESFNYAGLFNYQPERFFNQTFKQLNHLSHGPKFLALHSCYLHTPVHLTKEEIHQISGYWKQSPKDFSFTKWPKPGAGYKKAQAGWINPYPLRRQSLLNFLSQLSQQLKEKHYLEKATLVLLSDHGERFIAGKEIYGGVHGVDLKTQEQTNVILAFLSAQFKDFQSSQEKVSLVDIAPTVLKLLQIDTKPFYFDGLALLENNGDLIDLSPRKIKMESMGYLNHQELGIEFPQIAVSTLQSNLRYKEDGGVVIDKKYYEKIVPEKIKKAID
ncbi:MAG: sulfatase-like hydrolase/transferase [Deltaproteobacteria bacterium]|nr:sulfatase-like hydrolase/transferase [Deltaproteobacteria bacterium]